MTSTRYELEFDAAPNALTPAGRVEGAIVEHRGGLGCLQPWPSLGDAPLETHLGALRRGAPTAMGRAALLCCAADAAAKAEGRSMLDGLEVPRSHRLWDGGDLGQGVELIKVKSLELLEACKADVGVRVDLNASLAPDEFRHRIDGLSASARERIDFVEDPVPYDPEVWEQLASQTGLRFALDRGPADATRGFAIRVWKPACLPEPPAGERFCITHNMDHEVGRRWAKYQAATFTGELVACGLE